MSICHFSASFSQITIPHVYMQRSFIALSPYVPSCLYDNFLHGSITFRYFMFLPLSCIALTLRLLISICNSPSSLAHLMTRHIYMPISSVALSPYDPSCLYATFFHCTLTLRSLLFIRHFAASLSHLTIHHVYMPFSCIALLPFDPSFLYATFNSINISA
ncbi:unnamed protein product [Acanthosepion pharaonis]|uniref:Uncharacterized protein n=1 Tax=Acanthosepion pharaonis TaxID=158019 RepID=A0A812E8G7_ACAPH|nr:unnamed protein product [Sepia pharaonis]